ncbi:uncharacterized protein NEMAJ01_1736 [Nematocida major]|uniref:uncharacterized protein n=1 Tax=Nematocida major TaxID=1912982 RepID=UPI002008D066|nr:uncharacterized protein NEMAJ01_1736 [Nematocida major]KAH9386840.1 hypothetical protein NEMAJ01_1736 [Nematocida major]
MSWEVHSSCRKFFVGDIFTTTVSIRSPEERVLVASCNFTGAYLRRTGSSLFLETERVVLGVNTPCIKSEYSLFLPKNIPPSYSGANIAIVYSLNVYIQDAGGVHSKSILCSVVSGSSVCFESSSKMRVSEKYASIREESDSSRMVEASSPAHKSVHCYQEIVDLLRRTPVCKKEAAEFLLSPAQGKPHAFEALCKPLQQLQAHAKAFLRAERENTSHPLGLYHLLCRGEDALAESSRQSVYSITSQGTEYAKASLRMEEEDSPHYVLSLFLEARASMQSVKVSLFQMERVDDAEERSCFFALSKDMHFAKNVRFTIPLNKARNPTILTPSFNTQVEMLIEIDSAHSARIKIQ